jgi:phosphate:Na+ symporter
MVRTGMTRAFGAALRQALSACSRSRVHAFGGGLFVAGLLQSSTATALLLSSFTGRGLITLGVALAMMLGADVGATLAAQVLSFDVTWLSPLAIAAGTFLFLGSPSDRVRHMARIGIGLGLMLLALHLIAATAAPLRQSPAFMAVASGMHDEAVLAMLIAAAITWLVHSSLSMVLLIMSFTTAGLMPVEIAFAMVLGTNIGGAVAPFFDQAGAPAAARRVPLGNILMRTATALAVLFLVPRLVPLLAQIEAEPARLVINFHTAFNLLTALIFLPLVGLVARLCVRMLPEKPESTDPGRPRYLDPNVLDAPSEALACAMRETLHLGDRVEVMLRQTMEVLERDDPRLTKEIEKSDDAIDKLYEAIKLYLIAVSRQELSLEESRRSVDILTFTTNLEHVGDIIDKNLMELAAKKSRNRYTFSAQGLVELKAFHGRVMDNLRLAFNVFATRDLTLARRLLAEKTSIRDAELRAAESHFDRLREGRPESLETSSIHLDIVRDLKRINSHLTSVAYPILEAAGELRETRLRSDQAATETSTLPGRTATS